MIFEIAIAVGAVLMSALLTGVARRLALSHGVLDVPNARSSHQIPTPRGGGVAIVLTCVVGSLVLFVLGRIPANLLWALTGGGVAVAIVGLLDDSWHVPAGVRFTVHIAAALWALWWLGGLPTLIVGERVVTLKSVGDLLGLLGIVWMINLFNFMDGIDSLAASEAAFVAAAAVLLGIMAGGGGAVVAMALIVGAACCGFLLWNWPPAKIFMGDVGSGYLGYGIGVLALAASNERPADLWVWLILMGVFIVDATVTLIRRLARGERVYQAHRSHAYQWLARRWGSHRRVSLTVVAVNLLWLLPWAFIAGKDASRAAWVTFLALVPLIALAVASGAGRREIPASVVAE